MACGVRGGGGEGKRGGAQHARASERVIVRATGSTLALGATAGNPSWPWKLKCCLVLHCVGKVFQSSNIDFQSCMKCFYVFT